MNNLDEDKPFLGGTAMFVKENWLSVKKLCCLKHHYGFPLEGAPS